MSPGNQTSEYRIMRWVLVIVAFLEALIASGILPEGSRVAYWAAVALAVGYALSRGLAKMGPDAMGFEILDDDDDDDDDSDEGPGENAPGPGGQEAPAGDDVTHHNRVGYQSMVRPYLNGILLALVAALCAGCQTPEAVRRLEAESVASIEAYHDKAEAAVAGLVDAYEAASVRELDAVTALALAEEVEQARVRIGTDEEGFPIVEDREILDPEKAARAFELYRDRTLAIRAEADRFRARWAEAGADYSDALRLRGRLKDYLEAGGVEPEHVETLADALAREIERRGR